MRSSIRGSIIFVLCFSFIFAIYFSGKNRKFENLIKQMLPHAYVGVVIKDTYNGRILYSHNANNLFTPASNIKLFTAAAAIYQLGRDYRYITSISKKNNDIYLTFTGSPTFTRKNLEQMVHALKASGISNITGNIVIDDSRFQAPYYGSGVSYEDMGWYYAAPSSAIIINDNAEPYEADAKKLGQPIKLTAQVQKPALTLINDTTVVTSKEARTHCSLHIEIKPNNMLRLYGCVAQKEKASIMQFAITDPTLLVKQIITESLVQDNIRFTGNIMLGNTPKDATPVLVFQSPKLESLITHMLQESDNLYADSITKLLGYEIAGQGTYKQGIFAIKQILKKHTHLNFNQIEFTDGAGSRFNYVTPEQIVTLLTDLYQSPQMYALFMRALPKMGVSGTLKDRMKKSPLYKKVVAKTGSMHDISSLSGYLKISKNRTIIFSIVSNDVSSSVQKAKNMENKILLTIL